MKAWRNEEVGSCTKQWRKKMDSIRHSRGLRIGRPWFTKLLVWNAAFVALATQCWPFGWTCVMVLDPISRDQRLRRQSAYKLPPGVWFQRLQYLFPNVTRSFLPVRPRPTKITSNRQKHEGKSEQNRRVRKNLASLLASFHFC